MSEELGLAQFVDWVSDVKQLVELALAQFGDAWHKDNVNYTWLHKNWSHTRDRPRPNTWGAQIKQLERDVRKAPHGVAAGRSKACGISQVSQSTPRPSSPST